MAVVVIVALVVHLQEAVNVHIGGLARLGRAVKEIGERFSSDAVRVGKCGIPVAQRARNDALTRRRIARPVVNVVAGQQGFVIVCTGAHAGTELKRVVGIDALRIALVQLSLIIHKRLGYVIGIVLRGNPVVKHVDRSTAW